MKEYFSEKQTCYFCKKEKPCVSVLGVSARPDGSKPRVFPNRHKPGRTLSGPAGTNYYAERYICEDCAREHGTDCRKLWITWAVSLAVCIVAGLITLISLSGGSDRPSPAVAVIPLAYTVFVICSVIFVARWDGQNSLFVLLAFTPLVAIPILLMRKSMNSQRLAKTAMEPYMQSAIKADVQEAKDKKAGLAPEQAAAKPAAPAAAAVKKSEPEDPGNTFYVFVVKGRGLGRETPGMQTDLAKGLKSDCAEAAGMKLKIVEPSAWSGSVETEDSGGVFMSSAGISGQIPGIRYYLKRAGVDEDAAEAGIAELESRKLQRVNPAGGLFAFGVPVK